MLRTFIQVSAILLTLIASVLLVKGALVLTPTDILGLSSSTWDYNRGLAKNFSKQQADTKIGFMLLLLSFSVQMVNLLWPMRIDDFGVNKIGAAIAILVVSLIFFTCLHVSKNIAMKTQQAVADSFNQGRQKK